MATSYTRLNIAKEILLVMLANDGFVSAFKNDPFVSMSDVAAETAVRYADALIKKADKRESTKPNRGIVQSKLNECLGINKMSDKQKANLLKK